MRPVTSSQRAFSQRKVVSQFEKWNEQPCVLIMPDLQELHWTNEPKAERIRSKGCSRSRDTVIYSAGRYSEESSRIRRIINNIPDSKICMAHLWATTLLHFWPSSGWVPGPKLAHTLKTDSNNFLWPRCGPRPVK